MGFLAKIGASNDLHTRAVAIAELSYAGKIGNAFQAEGEATILAAGSGEQTVLTLVNNGVQALQIGNIFVSTRIEIDPSKVTVVKLYLGKIASTLGNLKIPVNLNTGAISIIDATLRDGNPTITGTDFKILELYFQTGNANSFNIPFDGGIVLQTGGSFRVTVTGAAAVTAGLTCDVSFQFWREINL